MKSKYYKPSIEEFHIGFEYETWFKDKGWTKQALNKKLDGLTFLTYMADMYPEKLRVKHLDREDIESLGFKSKELKSWEREEESIIFRKNNYTIVFWKDAYESDYKTNIYIKQETGLGLHCFKGECKNKSELKILLKQLDVL